MTPEETQIFRDTILMTTRNYPRGITRMSLDICLRSAGFTHHTYRDLDFHLEYLVSKTFLEVPNKSHTPELRMFKLTAAGVDDLSVRGL